MGNAVAKVFKPSPSKTHPGYFPVVKITDVPCAKGASLEDTRNISSILELKERGLSVCSVAKDLNLTPLQVMFCYLKFKE